MTLHRTVIFCRDLSGFELSTFNFAPSAVNFAPVTSYQSLLPSTILSQRIMADLRGSFFLN